MIGAATRKTTAAVAATKLGTTMCAKERGHDGADVAGSNRESVSRPPKPHMDSELGVVWPKRPKVQ